MAGKKIPGDIFGSRLSALLAGCFLFLGYFLLLINIICTNLEICRIKIFNVLPGITLSMPAVP
jgi:hypothetical protein